MFAKRQASLLAAAAVSGLRKPEPHLAQVLGASSGSESPAEVEEVGCVRQQWPEAVGNSTRRQVNDLNYCMWSLDEKEVLLVRTGLVGVCCNTWTRHVKIPRNMDSCCCLQVMPHFLEYERSRVQMVVEVVSRIRIGVWVRKCKLFI